MVQGNPGPTFITSNTTVALSALSYAQGIELVMVVVDALGIASVACNVCNVTGTCRLARLSSDSTEIRVEIPPDAVRPMDVQCHATDFGGFSSRAAVSLFTPDALQVLTTPVPTQQGGQVVDVPVTPANNIIPRWTLPPGGSSDGSGRELSTVAVAIAVLATVLANI